jgi:hypothetical protein
MAKMDTKVVCRTLETGKRYRFLAQKESEAMQASTSDACNTPSYKQLCLIRCNHSFSAVGPRLTWRESPCANGRPPCPDQCQRCKAARPSVALLRRNRRDAARLSWSCFIACARLYAPGGSVAPGTFSIDKRSAHRLLIRSSVATLRGWQYFRGLGGRNPLD